MSADSIIDITAILIIVVFIVMIRAIYGFFAWKEDRNKAIKQLFGAPAGGLAILAILIIVFQPDFESQTAIAQGEHEVRVTQIERSALQVEQAAALARQEAEESARRAAEEALRSPPPDQRQFLEIIARGRQAYLSGTNDLVRGAARPQRAAEICSLLRSRNVTGWIGSISGLSTNSEGRGILSVTIDENLVLKTVNNSFSDTQYRTLIEPTSPVYRAALEMSVGTEVRFSGNFFDNRTDCFLEISLTMRGSMTDPEFIFHFSGLELLQ